MTPQTKAIIVGLATAAVGKYYFKQSWQMVTIMGAIALVGYTVISDLPDKSTSTPATGGA